jgi:hypothetical protein
MKQDENEQNCKKQSTLVVGNKPNGKSRGIYLISILFVLLICDWITKKAEPRPLAASISNAVMIIELHGSVKTQWAVAVGSGDLLGGVMVYLMKSDILTKSHKQLWLQSAK